VTKLTLLYPPMFVLRRIAFSLRINATLASMNGCAAH
jgi:hypothetical protein